jgi:hypothetical protein
LNRGNEIFSRDSHHTPSLPFKDRGFNCAVEKCHASGCIDQELKLLQNKNIHPGLAPWVRLINSSCKLFISHSGCDVRKLVIIVAAVAMVDGGPPVAADLPMKTPAYVSPAAATRNWTGFYISGSLGYGWAAEDNILLFTEGAVRPVTVKI